jgi:hypothetical protein
MKRRLEIARGSPGETTMEPSTARRMGVYAQRSNGGAPITRPIPVAPRPVRQFHLFWPRRARLRARARGVRRSLCLRAIEWDGARHPGVANGVVATGREAGGPRETQGIPCLADLVSGAPASRGA